MKQFEIECTDLYTLERDLNKIELWIKSTVISNIVFHIFTEKLDKNRIIDICNTINNRFPSAKYLGCTTNGNIYNGNFTRKDTIICTVFEYVTTKIDILQYSLTDDTEEEVTNKLINFVKKNPWVKAIEFLTTIRGMSMTNFCNHLSNLPSNIEVFGGGAFAEDINDNNASIFSSVCSYSDHSIAFLLMGGDDFYIKTNFVAGWKPLGRNLLITKTKGFNLIELDNKPAYDTYYRYLKIKNDKYFFKNTLEFPFIYKYNGIDILRAPTSCTEDGTLIMTSNMEENANARIAYGDPWTILSIIKTEAENYLTFSPESMAIYSCAARRTFWGDNDVSKELMPFRQLASTYGFYTSSEFQRTNGYVIQHNVTLVIAAMREGPIPENQHKKIYTEDEVYGGASMINRLANFIQASTDELEDAIVQLKNMAITDGLTGLYNRKEIQRQIGNVIQNITNEPISIIMMDIDNFKHVNDTYGHAEGDNVLISLAKMMKNNINKYSPTFSVGRWGGEEFMLLCPNTNIQDATYIAEVIRKDFADLKFEQVRSCTMSLGITQYRLNETIDDLCKRVDDALYEAKSTGKNKIVVKN